VDELQVVVTRSDPADPFSMDEMVLRVATRVPDRAGLAALLAGRAQAAVRVRPRVEFVDLRSIYDAERQTKAVRFVDRR
jgi:hypothetical protein